MINLAYLCIGSWWRRNTYNIRNKQYGVGFGCWTANICKIRKTQHQEEPAVLDGIKKSVSESINEMPLTFVLVYREDAMFARSIKDDVIIFNNDLV